MEIASLMLFLCSAIMAVTSFVVLWPCYRHVAKQRRAVRHYYNPVAHQVIERVETNWRR